MNLVYSITAQSENRKFPVGYTTAYRFSFQGQEHDDEIKGSGNSINFKYRVHNPKLGRFLSIDPLVPNYPHYSPYAFAENKVIAFNELEGLEIALPRIGPISIPRPVITLLKASTNPIPYPPNFPIPPIALDPSISQIPTYPISHVKPLHYESGIDWTNPPSSPDDLGEDWEDITDPINKGGSKEYKHKESGEKIRWGHGKKGQPDWEGKDHWHRLNPNSKGKHDQYLDRFGNPVSRGECFTYRSRRKFFDSYTGTYSRCTISNQ